MLSDEEFAEIQGRAESVPGSSLAKTQRELSAAFFDRTRLVAEVAELRQRAEAAEQRLATATPIVEVFDASVYNIGHLKDGGVCMTVTHPQGVNMKDMQEQARAWLASLASAPAAVSDAPVCDECGGPVTGGLCKKCDYCPKCGSLMEACDGSLWCEVCLARADNESPEYIAQMEAQWMTPKSAPAAVDGGASHE